MRSQGRNVELDKCGRGHRGDDDVGRDRRQPHAEDDAGDCGHQQRRQEEPAADGDDGPGQLDAESGLSGDADDDAHTGTGHRHGHRGQRPVTQGVDDVEQRHPGALAHHRRRDRDKDRRHGREEDRRPGEEEHVEQEQQRQQQVPAFLHHVHDRRQILPADAAQTLTRRPQVDLDEDAQIVEHGRDDGDEDDLRVRNSESLGHDESRSAHDRRHDLTTHRGCRLDSTGEVALVPHPFHHRNREGPGGDDIGDRRAVDRPEESGGEHRDLGRAPARLPGEGQRDVVEELAHPRFLQNGAEEDEQEDVGRGHTDGCGEDALGGLVHEGDDPVEVIAAVPEEAGHRPSVVVVDDEEDGQDRQHEAGDSPGRFEDEDEAEDGEDDVDGLESAAADGQAIEDHGEVDGDSDGAGDAQPIEPRRGRSRLAEAEALNGKAEDEDRADVDAAMNQGRRPSEEGVVDLVEGEADSEYGQRQRPFR